MKRRTLVVMATIVACVATLSVPGSAYPRPGITEWVSVTPPGAHSQADPAAIDSSVSANGQWIAFLSPYKYGRIELNTDADAFVRDLRTRNIQQVDVPSDGGLPICGGVCSVSGVTISANGRYVAFSSQAINLVPGDTNLVADVFVRDLWWDRGKGRTLRVSVDNHGDQTGEPLLGPHDSFEPSLSVSGRYVAFSSFASDLVRGDTNQAADAFVHDVRTGRTQRVSVSSRGTEGRPDQYGGLCGSLGTVLECNGGYVGRNPQISATGRYVTFWGNAALDPRYPQGVGVFFHDRKTGHTELASLTSEGQAIGPYPCSGGVTPGYASGGANDATVDSRGVSADGRFVVFESGGRVVPAGQCYTEPSIYVRDRKLGRTERVNMSSAGDRVLRAGSQFSGSMSADGRYVLFTSLDDESSQGSAFEPHQHAFVYDRCTGAVEMVSVGSGGQAERTQSYGYSLSASGRYVTFHTAGGDLDRRDTNGGGDVYLRDRGIPLGVGRLGGDGVQPTEAGSPAGDCPRGQVASARDSRADVAEPLTRIGANLVGLALARRPQLDDLFVRIEVEDMPPFPVADPALVYGVVLRAHGVLYEVRAQKIGAGAAFGLFRLDPTGLWTPVAMLRGGYGTTGSEVAFALPLRDLGLTRGGRLTHVEAFTAIGSFETGTARIIDSLRLARRSA